MSTKNIEKVKLRRNYMSRDIFEMVRELNIVEVMEDYITIEGKRGMNIKHYVHFIMIMH